MGNSHNGIKRIAAMLCITAVTAFAGIAQAHDGGWDDGGCGKQQHRHMGKLFGKLGLTDAQKAQAKAIFQGNRDVVKPIVANLRTERKNLEALLHADSIDEAAIRAETAKIAGIQADLNINKAKVGAQFRAILTPDQLAKLKTLRQKHSEATDK
ncbi:Spy/CpxP family protein refolding chaperone [Oryzomonas rubra]|nr:Spy/CpxP family protein refolding chaperone [Oryzomonas rubra]